jgi:hypothetical protein
MCHFTNDVYQRAARNQAAATWAHAHAGCFSGSLHRRHEQFHLHCHCQIERAEAIKGNRKKDGAT